MSRIRASGSEIERNLGRALWQAGLRYRKQYRVPGKPDFALVSSRIAIFCDSNFWHGYRWGTRVQAAFKRNRSFWILKIEANRRRDRRVNRKLRRLGWAVFRFWEHQIRNSHEDCVSAVLRAREDARDRTQIRKPKAEGRKKPETRNPKSTCFACAKSRQGDG